MGEQSQTILSLYRIDATVWRFVLLPVVAAGVLYLALWLLVGRRSSQSRRVCAVVAVATPTVAWMVWLFPRSGGSFMSWAFAMTAILVISVAGYQILGELENLTASVRRRWESEAHERTPQQRTAERRAMVVLVVGTLLLVFGTLYFVSR